jgi:hypothetical protein
VSSLKKHKQDLQNKQKKAAQEVEKAMGEIDQILGEG